MRQPGEADHGKDYRFKVLISERQITALFDMLRYDAAVVVDWNYGPDSQPPRFRTYTLTLRNESGPTLGRWSSFGIGVADVQRNGWADEAPHTEA